MISDEHNDGCNYRIISNLAGEFKREAFWVRIVEEWVRQNFLITKRNEPATKSSKVSIFFLMQISDSCSRTCRSFYCLEIISLNWLSLAGGPGSPTTTVNLQSSLLKPHQSMVLLLLSPFVLAQSRERSKPAKIMPETISRRNGASTTRNCYQIT